MEKIYSNRIWMSFLQYMERKFGRDVADRILAETGVDRLTLTDASGFQTNAFGEQLIGAAARITGQKDISYQAGRATAESLGAMGGFVIGLTSPALFMRLLQQIEGKLALKTLVSSESLGNNQYRVKVSFKDGFQENIHACQNRIGTYESFPRVFGLPYGKVEHTECVFRGGKQCEYIVTIPENRFILFKKIALGLAAAAAVFVVAAFFSALPGLPWGAVAATIGALGAYGYYKSSQAAKSTEWSMLATEGMANQNREMEKDNRQISSLQALTVSLSEALRVQEICDDLVTVLVRDFGYGSSMIWLLDDDRKFLANRAAHGYSENLTAFIRNTRFEMGRDWDNPYGLLVQTMDQGKTLIVNDVDAALEKLTPRTKEFISSLKPSSFIIAPLIHNRTPIGILTAEHHGGLKLDNKDRLLFLSISNIVANALTKAELIERMAYKIELRTRELQAANQQLMAAKEMAIQSEKLSSLGQMAAGVAHEINNPLNFLVNIIPDVRRDVEALEKIRRLALEGVAGANLVKQVLDIDAQYDLEAHLDEKDFVFERIQKALDKSTRIANSLKVFSRSSSKEKIELESFGTMIKEVVDLIPRKVLGDTQIEVDIAHDLCWNVNKNEIEQAFLSLINNAVDAMAQKGKVQISGRVAGGDILLAFKDEGPGIPEDVLKKIFDPFYTTKPPGKGTGLGLTIASEIVRKYGGNLSVESQPGKGATFLIRFKQMTGESKDTGKIPAVPRAA